MYSQARHEHILMLRAEGVTYREIGERLGVCTARARQLAKIAGHRLGRAIRFSKLEITLHP